MPVLLPEGVDVSGLVVHTQRDGTTRVAHAPKTWRVPIATLRAAIGSLGVTFLIRIGRPLAATYRVVAWDEKTGHWECELEDQEQD